MNKIIEYIDLLHEAVLQLEYLDKKFPSTGTTANILNRIKTFLALNTQEKENEKIDSIEVPEWWKGDYRSIRRDSLPSDHPESTYMYIKNVLKKVPEEYGILTDTMKKYKDYTKEELLTVISEYESNQRIF